MGATVWIEVSGRPLKETANDCSFLPDCADELDKLSAEEGVSRLESFYDWTEMNHAADAEMRFLEWQDGPQTEPEPEPTFRNPTAASPAEREAVGEWFDSAEGLRTVRALRQRLSGVPDTIDIRTNPNDVNRYRRLLEELAFCEHVLKDAIAAGKRFRLLVVP